MSGVRRAEASSGRRDSQTQKEEWDPHLEEQGAELKLPELKGVRR